MEIDLKETMEMEDQETGYGELHLHLDGAITPRIAKKLAALQGIELPYAVSYTHLTLPTN